MWLRTLSSGQPFGPHQGYDCSLGRVLGCRNTQRGGRALAPRSPVCRSHPRPQRSRQETASLGIQAVAPIGPESTQHWESGPGGHGPRNFRFQEWGFQGPQEQCHHHLALERPPPGLPGASWGWTLRAPQGEGQARVPGEMSVLRSTCPHRTAPSLASVRLPTLSQFSHPQEKLGPDPLGEGRTGRLLAGREMRLV